MTETVDILLAICGGLILFPMGGVAIAGVWYGDVPVYMKIAMTLTVVGAVGLVVVLIVAYLVGW